MDKYKNRICLFAAFIITLSFSCKAQNQNVDSTSLKGGIWALQFGISSNFTLTSFQGSTIGAKYQLSKNSAIRGGITLNGSTNRGPTSSSGTIGDTSLNSAPGSTSNKSIDLSFVFQYLWYMNPNGIVHLYAGVGPSVSYNYYKYAYDSPRLYQTGNHGYWVMSSYDNHYTQWAAGVAASIGVEWFACSWLSLRADYNESLQYQWGSTTTNENSTTTSTTYYTPYSLDNSGNTKGWNIRSSVVGFGLNVYLL